MSGQPAALTYVLACQQAAGVLKNTYTTAASILNPTDLFTLPQGALRIGSCFRVTAFGGLSNIVTTPGTTKWQVVVGGVAVWDSGSIQMTTTANTLVPWYLQVLLRLDSVGNSAAAKFMAVGFVNALNLTIGSGANPTVTDSSITIPVTSPAVGTGFDNTVAAQWDLFQGFSISNAGNGTQLYFYCVEQLAGGA